MREWMRSHLRFANVVSVMALFVALGGTAIAATVITSNSQVGPGTISGHKPPSGKHANVISGSVDGRDVANNSLNGTKINESTLGEVPSARTLGGVRSTAFSRIAHSGIASNAIPAPSGGSGTARQVSINAPRSGFLLAIASANLFNNNDNDDYRCILNLDGRDQRPSQRTGQLFFQDANEGTCDTNAAFSVTKGVHVVKFNFDDLDNTTVVDASELDVVFIPFAG